MSHLGPDKVRQQFKGMVERCGDCGFDLAGGLVEVVPTAHYMMGGVVFRPDTTTELTGLFAAGEDTGGVHGANRLGGNGVAESMVFGAVAGDAMARDLASMPQPVIPRDDVENLARRLSSREGDRNPFALRRELGRVAWDCLGIVRSAASIAEGVRHLDSIAERLVEVPLPAQPGASASLQERMNIENLLVVAGMIAHAAALREESRGSHYREDFPDTSADGLYNLYLRRDGDGTIASERRAVRFTRRQPRDLLGDTRIPDAPATSMTTEV
jgi:fumarate reductase flavoprotein subunit